MRSLKNALFLLLTVAVALLALRGVVTLTRGDSVDYSIFDLFSGAPALKPGPSAGSGPGGVSAMAQAQIIRREPTDRTESLDLNSLSILEQVNESFAVLTEQAVQSVVSIDTKTTIDVARYVPVDPFGLFGYRRGPNQRYQSPGLGSGVIVSEDGYVLTNHHVVANVDEIEVTIHGGEKFKAEWIGSDESIDIAVVKILEPVDPTHAESAPKTFQPLPFGNSDETRVGEMALAIGNPFGLSETVTRGIISAKQRQLSDGANQYFQVDAVINPGNSGGPLINVRGEIIGINVALFTGQEEVRVWQGVGLAVPSNDAEEVYEAIVHDRPLLRGYIGVNLSDINAYLARRLGLRSTNGAIVTQIADDSPAKSAGVLPGDVIVKFGDADIASADQALQRIRRAKMNADLPITVIRQSQEVELSLQIAEKPDTSALKLRRDLSRTGKELTDALGFKVRDLKLNEREALGLGPETPAIIITEVDPASQATSRFRPGDLIHAIDQDPVTDAEKFYDLLGSLTGKSRATMLFTRNGQRLYATLTPGQ